MSAALVLAGLIVMGFISLGLISEIAIRAHSRRMERAQRWKDSG